MSQQSPLCRFRLAALAFAPVVILFSVLVQAESPWTPDPSNPQFSGSFWTLDAWNDPDVLRTADEYWMYLSVNYLDFVRNMPVRIHRARSNDGIVWDVDPDPVLSPGSDPGSFDYTKVETPSVISYDGSYHMYYCGINESIGTYQIGHATSEDGTAFVRDPHNPVLSLDDITDAGSVIHVCEPGVIVWQGSLRVYFVVVAVRPDAGPPAKFMIYFADTTDGSSFGPPVRILEQTRTHPAGEGFAGYSTPAAMVDGGHVRLYYDVYRWTPGDPISNYTHVALFQASSNDGTRFDEDCEVFPRGAEAWTTREVRSPSPLGEADRYRLWYAGDSYEFSDEAGWSGATGIGTAEAPISLHADGDGDGLPDHCDCAPADASLLRSPREVRDLRLLSDGQTVSWESVRPDAGTASRHDLIRGDIAGLPVGSGPSRCLAREIAEAEYDDGEAPVPGAAFWYLARGRNYCAVGTWGSTSAGTPRADAGCD